MSVTDATRRNRGAPSPNGPGSGGVLGLASRGDLDARAEHRRRRWIQVRAIASLERQAAIDPAENRRIGRFDSSEEHEEHELDGQGRSFGG